CRDYCIYSSINRDFITKFHKANQGVGLYTRNSNLIPEKEISRDGDTTHYHYSWKIV
ncbi:hypothetical protein LDENG_00005230, partial [Lucifuga dentata]